MKTPLNYTGNKSRLVKEFMDYFPDEVDTFVDLFCGGATVGLSVNAKKIIFIDSNSKVIGLLKHLATSEFEKIVSRLEKMIIQYKLSYSAKYGYSKYREGISTKDNNGLKSFNSVGYYSLRSDYNALKNKNSKKSFDMLYLLIIYSFNNDMRFNRAGEFNLPIGKTDLNKMNLLKLRGFIERIKNIKYEFICGDFREVRIKKILLNADFVYCDPPYLITDAVYNETSNWTEKTEAELIELLDTLTKKKVKFALSNVLNKVGAVNKPLNDWIFRRNDLHVINIDYHYRGASYNKINRNSKEREVLIKNY